MNLQNPRKALNGAYLKIKPNRSEIELFKSNLVAFLERIDDKESEEFHKNLISDFLKDTYYKQNHFINTKGRNDLVIHNGNTAQSSVGVIIEAKKFGNKSEMVSKNNLNAKAFQELVLYFLRERISNKNLEIKNLIITNVYEWYVFDANFFDKLFAKNKALIKQFEDFENGRLSGKTTDVFYNEIAKPFISEIEQEIEFAYFDLRDYEKTVRNADKEDDNQLIALYKILSPEHLLKLPFLNDSNTLDKGFYSELLHIIGLTETKDGGKRLIERNKEGQRHSGTMLEDTIIQLDSLNKINRLDKAFLYGETHEERLFNVALTLNITWINRILFLKLLEAQLITYHKGDKAYSFLNREKIKEYDDLNSLFFQVLAKDFSQRNEDVKKLYEKVPYLNSSLFEPTEIEHQTLFISNLKDDKIVPILSTTVLKDEQGKKRTGNLTALQYLFEFLDSYDFSSEGSEEIQEENKTLINASVLGLIFEKINGYKDGSFFTPGMITMYMCRETLRKAVVQKFNETKAWNVENFDDLYNKIEDKKEANTIINSVKICDPAVGSGHFLVSALNELIAIKNDLKILIDKEGKSLNFYHVEVENDELVVTDEDGKLFEYNPKSKESQRVQETLFHEKQIIIENCLFGVDINPNSVKICRLRLWIELLKNAYYKTPTELETLPNIDINIKNGNSLISRFDLDSDLKTALKKSNISIDDYKNAVSDYRNADNKEQKWKLEKLIEDIKTSFRTEINRNSKEIVLLNKLRAEYFSKYQTEQLFEVELNKAQQKDKKELETKIQKIEDFMEEIKNNKIYENAFEWRFEFPEVLDDDGNFIGFDAIIGNPPYIKEYEGKEMFDGLRTMETYQGKIDMWYLFGELGHKILKEKGLLTFIAPNNWVTNAGASKFRNYLLSNMKLLTLVDFGAYFIFDTASIQTMIFEWQKTKEDKYNFDYRKIDIPKPQIEEVQDLLSKNENGGNTYIEPIITVSNLIDKTLSFNNNKIEQLLQKIENKGTFKLTDDEVAQGIVGAPDKCFLIEKKDISNFNDFEQTFIKPFYTNSSNQYSHYIIYLSDKNFSKYTIEDVPNIKKHFEPYIEILKEAKIKYKTPTKPYYYLHRERDEKFFKQGEKIVCQIRTEKPNFLYTENEYYASRATNIIVSNRLNIKLLSLIYNSKLIDFYYQKKGAVQGNLLKFDKTNLLNIPIALPNDMSKFMANVDIQNINFVIYKLYDLTFEEAQIIDPAISIDDFQLN